MLRSAARAALDLIGAEDACGEHLAAFIQPEAKPSLLHPQLSIIHRCLGHRTQVMGSPDHHRLLIHQPGNGQFADITHQLRRLLTGVPARDARLDAAWVSSVVIVQPPDNSRVPGRAYSRARPLPQDHHKLHDLHRTCGSGHARERAGSGDTSLSLSAKFAT